MRLPRVKRLLTIFLPVALIGFLIISITLTFGNTDAGKAMGILEGSIVVLLAIWLMFIKEINTFLSKNLKTFIKKVKKRKLHEKIGNGETDLVDEPINVKKKE